MKLTIVLFLSLVVLVGRAMPVQEPLLQCPPHCEAGQWSGAASAAAGPPGIIYSPDGHSAIHVVGDHWWLEIDGQTPAGSKKFSLADWREFGWAADSKTFYLTQSEGYSSGYWVEIYKTEGGRVRRFAKIDRVVRKEFDRRHRCGDGNIGNDPNTAGVLWVKDATELLLVAEVPPIGICRDSEYFGGYLISVPGGRIIARYSPGEMMARWNQLLGERLKSNFKNLNRKQQSMTP